MEHVHLPPQHSSRDHQSIARMVSTSSDVDSLGWKGASTQQIVQRCLDGAVPGAIYLFHVGSASQDGPALQDVIDGLRARGYSFATVAALIGA
jgi:peptidoglycan/xylan/chitin deacetylase (PgdA/CDA1 family)